MEGALTFYVSECVQAMHIVEEDLEKDDESVNVEGR